MPRQYKFNYVSNKVIELFKKKNGDCTSVDKKKLKKTKYKM